MKFFHSLLFFLVSTSSLCRGEENIQQDRVYPVVVLGGGVGALTSAVYLERAGIETIVVEGQTPGGAIAQSPNVHNWPGEVQIDGSVLVEKIRAQAEYNGATFRSEEVIDIDFSKHPLVITTRDVFNSETLHTIRARTAIIATGSTPRLLGIPGESGKNGYWTQGVYTCAVCDGALYKNKDVAVVGGGDSAIIEADYLSKIARKVYVLVRSNQFRTVETLRKNQLLARDNVEVLYNTEVKEIHGNGQKMTHLTLESREHQKQPLKLDGLFIAIGANPNTELFKRQLDLDANGYIKLKEGQETSKRGVYAIGDVCDPDYKQAVSAAGDGAKAALQVERFLAATSSHQHPVVVKTAATPPTGDAKQNAVESATQGVKEITSIEMFDTLLNQKELPLVIDFYSPYCGPCRQLMPKFEEMAKKYQKNIKFFKVNVADQTELASRYQVYAVPTVIVFSKEGEMIDRRSGKEIYDLLNHLDQVAKGQ